jgi:hypothetical protein
LLGLAARQGTPDMSGDEREEEYLAQAASQEAKDEWLKIADGYRVLARYAS